MRKIAILLISVALFLGLSATASYAQSSGQKRTVTGVVFDDQDQPVVGAGVFVVGTTKGVNTNIDGQFSIGDVPENAVLQVSCIGYVTQNVSVAGKNEFYIKLAQDSKLLDEVVIVGYGSQKRGHLTGSVSAVTSQELNRAPMQNVNNMLAGKVPGLTAIQSSGKPGEDFSTLYIRGINNFNGSSPMIIVDGVPRTMSYLNPTDIQSVTVLKDAAAAIYGVQAAGGVILVTTKSGSEGAAKISYDGSVSLVQNTAMPEYLNATDFMYYHNMAREMDGLDPLWTADIQNKVLSNDPNSIYGETDWLGLIFRNGVTHQHTISASGGSKKAKYYVSLGYMNQEGTLKNTSFTRYNVRANVDVKVAKDLTFTLNLGGYHTDRDWPGTSIYPQSEFNPIRAAISTIPIIKSEYKGYPTGWNTGYVWNAYDALYNSGYIDQDRWNVDSNYKLEYDFGGITDALKGLKASIFGAYNFGLTADKQYMKGRQLYSVNASGDESIVWATGSVKDNAFSKSASYGTTWMLRPQIEYSRDFGKHHVGALFLYEATKSYSDTMTGSKRGYVSDDPVDISLGSEFTETPVTGSYSYSGQASYVGRVNYAYASKYLAEFAFRYDGSYVFAPENRWGFFPSASVGWVLSEESFIKDNVPFINYLKLRASYGESGNDGVTPFLYNSTYSLASNSYVLGGSSISQFYTTNAYVYRNLTWATTHSYNVGLEFDLWKGMLGGEVDVFYQLTEDILESQGGSYPTSLGGYYPSYQNSGKVDNRGIEITLKHHNRIDSNWSYGLTGTFSFARNRILEKAVSDSYPNYRAVLGESIGRRYGFQAIGLFQTQEQIDNYPAAPSGSLRLGDIMYKDINGDGIISSTYDYIVTGYGQVPEINFSLNMELNYKNWYLTALWQGVSHCDYELSGVYDSGVTASTNYTSVFTEQGNSPYYLVEGSWRPDHTDAKYPRLTTQGNGNNAWQSTMWVINGEYLRLKNLTIGYEIPEKALTKTPFSRVNLYLAGTNLLTFSHFKYVDPESPSVSRGTYPQQKTYSFGVNVTF